MRALWKFVSSKNGRVVVSVLVLAAAAVAVLNLDRRTTRERAMAWAASHRQALPATLEEIAAFPPDYQKAIMRELPSTEKSRLWRTHLQSLLDHDAALNEKQRGFLVETIALVTPASFESANPPELCDRIIEAFPDFRQRMSMIRLASLAEPSSGINAKLVNMSERVRSSVVVYARSGACNCRGLGICECALLEGCDQETCTPTNDCGCIWEGPCSKRCNLILELRAPAPVKTTTQ